MIRHSILAMFAIFVSPGIAASLPTEGDLDQVGNVLDLDTNAMDEHRPSSLLAASSVEGTVSSCKANRKGYVCRVNVRRLSAGDLVVAYSRKTCNWTATGSSSTNRRVVFFPRREVLRAPVAGDVIVVTRPGHPSQPSSACSFSNSL